MKISMFKFYKTYFWGFGFLGGIIIVGTIVLFFDLRMGIKDDFIILILGFMEGIVNLLFPLLIFYRQLTYVIIENLEYTSYTYFRRKLCVVSKEKEIFYSFFDVQFASAPKIKFVAISNESFVCNRQFNRIFERGFYGSYNRKKIVIFPYEREVVSLLDFEQWKRVF